MKDDISLSEKVKTHEWRLNRHDRKINMLNERQDHQTNTLDSILSVIKTVRTVLLTSAVFLVAAEIGLIETVKRLL